MLLKEGGGNDFSTLWESSGFNDPDGTKSEAAITNLVAGDDFKAVIDPLWGDPGLVKFLKQRISWIYNAGA